MLMVYVVSDHLSTDIRFSVGLTTSEHPVKYTGQAAAGARGAACMSAL